MDGKKMLLTARDAIPGPSDGLRGGPPSPMPPGMPPPPHARGPNNANVAQGTISKDGTMGAKRDGFERLLRVASRDPHADQLEYTKAPRRPRTVIHSSSNSTTSSGSEDDEERAREFETMVGLEELAEAETEAYHASLEGAGTLSDRKNIVSWKEGPHQNTDNGLTEALASVANSYLGVNPRGGSSDTAKYLSFLLERIHMLQSEVQFKTKQYEELAGKKSSSKIESKVQTPETSSESVKEPSKPFRVLHRIFCGARYHNHNHAIYEDLPMSNKRIIETGGDTALRGRTPILDQSAYLAQIPNVCFLVIKEHRCTLDPTTSFLGNLYQKGRVDFEEAREDPSERFERLKIINTMLQKAFIKVAQCKTDEILFGKNESSWEIEAPYHFIFHHRRKLLELVEQAPEYQPYVTPLLEYVHEHYGDEYKEAETSFQKGTVSREMVAKLFRPSQIIVSREDDSTNFYVLDEWPLQTADDIRFSGWSWKFDGRSLERNPWSGFMDTRFLDNTPICDLSIYPIDFADPEEISTVRARGKTFWSLRRKSMVSYSGWDFHHDDFYSNKRFMVDVMTYRSIHRRGILHMGTPPKSRSEGQITEKFRHKYSIEDELPEDAFLLFPLSIQGFSLEQKRWVTLNVAQVSEMTWNKRAIDRLVMDAETKELIQALVDVHLSSREKMSDIVMSKGNGLIILLHGSPGTGKTLTAECVAEFAEKPLYRVTCGDIGTEAVAAEKYLETVMHLGKIWDCVLLLDEADVFLEERSVMDLQRNSLVSVFLRILEYYEGILILTSNRVGIFDEAFKSRIQVAVQYNPLSREYRRKIWQNLLNMLSESDTVDFDVNFSEIERKLDELAAIEINGRQIRNALLTARQLALHRKETLDWNHLRDVLKISKRFTQYLKNVRGHSDEEWARNESWR